MSILNYFKPVETITANEARDIIEGKKPEEYCLLDVRQPVEYERGHIPGSVLVPLAQLQDRLGELNPGAPVIAYCAIGGRSRAAASILQDNGFKSPYNLKGGFNAWNGLAVTGPPETGMAYFKDADKPEEILLLAWALEEGTRRFYAQMAGVAVDRDAKEIYTGLAEAEIIHQRTISELFHTVTGPAPDQAAPFYTKYMADTELEQLVEGEMKLGAVLAWAKEHPLVEVLEFSLGLEAKLYDLYFRMKEKYPEPPAHTVYAQLAKEEKKHLDLFTDLLEKKSK